MSSPVIFALSKASTITYLKFKDADEEWRFARLYVDDHSILDSGWDFHWVSSNIAGLVGQLEKYGVVKDAGCLPLLGSFQFISDAILKTYFPDPAKCPLFIAHLFLKQQLLETCLVIIENQADQA